MSDQTKMKYVFLFSSKNNVELESQNRKRCRRVLWLQEASDLQLSSNIAIAFDELNDEGSDTLLRAWNTVSTSLHDQTTTHRQSVCEARI